METWVQPTVQMRDVWTVDDLDQLGAEDWWRYEIVDGSLVVSPSAGREHELVSADVRAAVASALPPGLTVVGPIGVRIGRSYRIPDLVVVERSIMRGSDPLEAGQAHLVVEVVSPGSQITDRITKPAQYAAAGIAHYWRVETDPVSLTAYELRPGAGSYVESGSWSAAEIARPAGPFPVELDLGMLLAD